MLRLLSTSTAWANSAPANTANTLDFEPPDLHPNDGKGGLLAIIVYSPSTVTALTGSVQWKWQDSGGTTRYATLATPSGESTFTVGTATTSTTDSQLFLIDGGSIFGGRLRLENATVLGAGDGFTAQVQVWSL